MMKFVSDLCVCVVFTDFSLILFYLLARKPNLEKKILLI